MKAHELAQKLLNGPNLDVMMTLGVVTPHKKSPN
jgi:hypothetical protein